MSRVFIALLSLTLIVPKIAHAFPVAAPGDSFSFVLSLDDPGRGPVCCSFPGFINMTFLNVGSAAFTVDGETIPYPVSEVNVAYTQSLGLSQWFADGVTSNTSMAITLLGSTPSNSFLPLSFSTYSQSTSFQASASIVSGPLTETYVYQGTITSLVRDDANGILDFEGNITSFNLESFVQTAVPEPSTWAMLLIGFAGIWLAGRRNDRICCS